MPNIEEGQRLLKDLRKNPQLVEELRSAGSAFAAVARKRGYNCSAADVLAAASGRLSDAQMEKAAGGKIAQSDVPDNMLALLAALRASTGPIPS